MCVGVWVCVCVCGGGGIEARGVEDIKVRWENKREEKPAPFLKSLFST